MPLPVYDKPHATPEQVVAKLRNRGLDIPDPGSAAETIAAMGYARLRMYLESRCDIDVEGRPFWEGVTFQNILRIHECDTKLRAACSEPVGLFEILFRNTIAETLSGRFGPHPYERDDVFKTPTHQENMLEYFEKLNDYHRDRDGFAKEYCENYSSPKLPPIWYMKEVMDFGKSLKLFNSLNPDIRLEITRSFATPNNNFMGNWVSAFIELRNVCAHHDRLFNRTFHMSVRLLDFGRMRGSGTMGTMPLEGVRRDKLAGVLQCLDYVTGQRLVSTNVEAEVGSILKEYPEIKLHEVGYPK